MELFVAHHWRMENEALLLGLAEVSITVAGFSGVVAALSRTKWGDLERFRLINLITFSVTGAMFSFLPLAVSAYDVPEIVPWIVSASFLAMFITAFQVKQLFALRKLPQTRGSVSLWAGRMIVTGSAVVVLLQLIGLSVPGVVGATYITGILIVILLAAIQFLVFVVGILSEKP